MPCSNPSHMATCSSAGCDTRRRLAGAAPNPCRAPTSAAPARTTRVLFTCLPGYAMPYYVPTCSSAQPRRRTCRSPCHPQTRCAFVYFYIRRQYSRHFKFPRPASGIGRTARLFIGPPKENLIFISISYVNQGKQNQPPFEFRLNSNGGWFCVGWKHFCQCVTKTQRWDEGSGFRFKFGAHA